MLGVNLKSPGARLLAATLRLLFAVAFSAAAILTGAASASEPLYPRALMNWMSEGTSHAMIVDKSQQRLTVWQIKNGEPTLVESYRCSTGENPGDKWVRGDMKTPEGVYLFCSVIDGRALPTKYGLWAFTTDYPNFVDRRRGKSGDGIWLHGRDKPLMEKPDSNGCIALENQDLIKVSRFIRLQATPLIVVDKIIWASRSLIMEEEREVRGFIESWRQAWESREVDGYMGFYSPNFQSSWHDHRQWKEKKRKLVQRYKSIRVRLGSVSVYRQDGLITAIFSQDYTSDSFRSTGLKVVYLTRSEKKLQIYAEDYHRLVDDPFPVRVLLAKTGADPGSVEERPADFRIRLVSTDEPEQQASGELETPMPTAPSRGVVLDRLSSGALKRIDPPLIEPGERVPAPIPPERLIVARMVPSFIPEDLPQSGAHSEKALRVVSDATRRAEEPEVAPIAPAPTVAPKTEPPRVSTEVVTLPAEQKGKEGRGPADATSSPTPATQASPIPASSSERKKVVAFLDQWKAAWEKKDLDSYVKMYHPNFGKSGADYESFLKSKKAFFAKYQSIGVQVDKVTVAKSDGRLMVRFLQSFRGDDYRDKGWKSMVLAGSATEGFRILDERWSPL